MTKSTSIYFVKPVGMDGPIKIGCSSKPMSRLKVLAAWSPFELELMGSVPGSFSDEVEIHRRFANLHTRKEWFLSSPVLRQKIEAILAGTPIKEACRPLEEKGAIRNQKRPAKTPDRELFLLYGRRVRNASQSVYRSGEHERHYQPADVRAIIDNWRSDRFVGKYPITPSPEQFARLEEFIADPHAHCVSYFEAFGKDPFRPVLASAQSLQPVGESA